MSAVHEALAEAMCNGTDAVDAAMVSLRTAIKARSATECRKTHPDFTQLCQDDQLLVMDAARKHRPRLYGELFVDSVQGARVSTWLDDILTNPAIPNTEVGSLLRAMLAECYARMSEKEALGNLGDYIHDATGDNTPDRAYETALLNYGSKGL